MSKTRKAKHSKDRDAEFLEHLKRYPIGLTDARTFPRHLPFRFRLKVASADVGWAVLDWQVVCLTLTTTTLAAARPRDETKEQFNERLTNLFKHASAEAKDAFLQPIYAMLFHVFECLPEQFDEALLQLLKRRLPA